MKFGHIADCHLGGWRQPELQKLNFESFKFALDRFKTEKVDFILIAGDLFDSAYPPIETIKETFNEFRKLKESNIPVFLISGSHDYSVSGKSFLDVLEKSGFVINVNKQEDKNGKIILHPTIHKGVALYGYPGRKSGLEVYDVERIKLEDSPGFFKILMLHTTLRDAIGSLPIPAVDIKKLPEVDYIAMGHLHLRYEKNNPLRVYSGPTFPNNASELEQLNNGSFYIIDTNGKVQRNEIKLIDTLALDIEVSDGINATDKLINELKNNDIKNKILILKVKGVLERGKISDIDFNKIEVYAKNEGVYSFLKNTTKLYSQVPDTDIELRTEDIEMEIVDKFIQQNPHPLNVLIRDLFSTFDIEKKEDETSRVFEERLISETKEVLKI